MQVTDFIRSGICPKTIVVDTTPYTARSKNGCTLHVLLGPATFTALRLTFDRSGNTNYTTVELAAAAILYGVKSFTLSAGTVLVLDPK